jgi:hypothetical protein
MKKNLALELLTRFDLLDHLTLDTPIVDIMLIAGALGRSNGQK